MDLTSKILLDREKRNEIINSYLDKYDCIALKANIMGPNKNVFESFILINYFEKVIDENIPNFSLKRKENSFDGQYLLYLYPKGLYQDLKEKTVKIEEEYKLGRIVDIDVYYDLSGSVHRGHLRKCLICDNPAYVCNRLNSHSYQELIETMDKLIIDELSEIIRVSIDQAIELELSLPYKFGCVCVNDQASHSDMNASIMRKAKNTIIPYLVEMFVYGYKINNLDDLFKEIRLIGISAENEMYKSTNGINCYKGLIFILGLLVSSLGYYFRNQNDMLNNIFDNIKLMTKSLELELVNSNTNGLQAYQMYKFKGARHEAMSGLQNVKENLMFCKDLEESSLEKTLINIILNIDDTVMLKRAKSIEKYLSVKDRIKNINSLDELIVVNNYCIKENISVGGACDILICVIFLKLINKKININGENYA